MSNYTLCDCYYKFEIISNDDLPGGKHNDYEHKLYLTKYTLLQVDFKHDRCILLNEHTQKHHTAVLSKISQEYSTCLLDAFDKFKESCSWRLKRFYEDIAQYNMWLDTALEKAIECEIPKIEKYKG